ncbi:hypothetical protein TUN199_07398 [Pyrenophora tritici-repentis]|uniref:Uncharacterized protein n=1 Tax=Pyrenophora tritici-repentis TaxID=45151 RepID=A0A317AJJ4_9PLEO|nr:hypothetical protein PtrM4_066560 [Pyrenophora tritici-repentis]KAI0620613.1 hypothetical protein TUN199_07398 [Pyrenophora tritici-repentis]KAI1519087.1 hypothetical protein Ptr86124_002215 [Pyrenophora tritici-repentis]KAI1672634.1 hypothetical protein L13192_03493 [Pyrenophora tritici-repentis]KAI1686666.1 hypothetical protein KJE20_04631 [Pyrenophora tritici-repentis]
MYFWPASSPNSWRSSANSHIGQHAAAPQQPTPQIQFHPFTVNKSSAGEAEKDRPIPPNYN